MAFDLESSSPADTGKGKELKTGNLKRSYNMATCPKGQVYDQKLKKCRVQKESADTNLKRSAKYIQVRNKPRSLVRRAGLRGNEEAKKSIRGHVPLETQKEYKDARVRQIKRRTTRTKKKVRGY